MQLTQEQIDRKRSEKKAKKALGKSNLMQMSDKRLQHRGAPNFGIKEEDLLTMKQKIQELVVSNNMLVNEIKKYRDSNVIDRAAESHYMIQVVMRLLVDKGICSEEEIGNLAQEVQTKDAGLVDKANGVAESGDVIYIKFLLYDGQELVDDQSKSILAYQMGSNGLPCDDSLIGMNVGETRMCDVVFQKGFKFEHLIGKTLQMQVTCCGVKTPVAPIAK